MKKIGQKVKVSDDNDNENYDSFRNKTLVITHVVKSGDDHPAFDSSMKGQGLYSFKTLDSEEVPFSLYDYELQSIY